MSTISAINQSHCFEAILKAQSWLPESKNSAVPERIRMIVLEKLLACQQEFARELKEIQGIPRDSKKISFQVYELELFKSFNEKTFIVSNFLSSPLGEIVVPKQTEVYQKIKQRLESNFQFVDRHLPVILKNLHHHLEMTPFNLEIFEKLFYYRYDCLDFAPLYVKLLFDASSLQIKDWLSNELHIYHTLTKLPCHMILKVFQGFQRNLSSKSYPHGFITKNLMLVECYKSISKMSPEARESLQTIEKFVPEEECFILTQLKSISEIQLLHKISRWALKPEKNKKQLASFLYSQKDRQLLKANFKRFRHLSRLQPNLVTDKWDDLFALQAKDPNLVENLLNQPNLRNKAQLIHKYVKIGNTDLDYCKKLVNLMIWCSHHHKHVFHRLSSRLSCAQLKKLKPLLAILDNELAAKALFFFSMNLPAFEPLLAIDENKHELWIELFASVKEPHLKEIQIFLENKDPTLLAEIYQPYHAKPFITEIQKLISRMPELETSFCIWLAKVREFTQNKKVSFFEQKNREIPIRIFEMKPEHVLPFFNYASQHYHYRHLSHLLNLEKSLKEDFLLLLSLIRDDPNHLIHINILHKRFGKDIIKRLLHAWERYPEIIGKIIPYSQLSKHFFEGFLIYIERNVERVLNTIDLNDCIPELFDRLDQDVHLLSTAFLKFLLNDDIVNEQFTILVHTNMPHVSSVLMRHLSESFAQSEEKTTRILALAHRHPQSLIYLLTLSSQVDRDFLTFFKVLENQEFHTQNYLISLLEHYEGREFVKNICKILASSNHRTALKLVDLALDGYLKEACELSHFHLYGPQSVFNKLLLAFGDSSNGELIKALLKSDDKQRELIDLELRKHPVGVHEVRRILDNAPTVSKIETESFEGINDVIVSSLESVKKTFFQRNSDKQDAYEICLSMAIARSIMLPSGRIVHSAIPKIRESVLSQSFIPAGSDAVQHVLHVLEIIERDEEDICQKLQAFDKKSPFSKLLGGLISNDDSSELRYAVLSALLHRPRQNNELGDCFAIHLDIQLCSSPKGLSLSLDDYISILSIGGLKRFDPIIQKWIEYKVPNNFHVCTAHHPSEHPLQKARQMIFVQMSSKLYSQKLLRLNGDLFNPLAKHNYLFRALQKSKKDPKAIIGVGRHLQNCLIELSEVQYDDRALDPKSKIPGAWRLLSKSKGTLIVSIDDYVEFLMTVVTIAKGQLAGDDLEILEHLITYLNSPAHFRKKLLACYKHKRQICHDTHWLDYSGGFQDSLRVRYFGNLEMSQSMKISRFIFDAKDALIEIVAFSDRLSNRVRRKLAADRHYRISVDYPHHCANLLLHDLKDKSAEMLLKAISEEIEAARQHPLDDTLLDKLVEEMRIKIPIKYGDYWAYYIYKRKESLETIGDFCDACREIFNYMCINPIKQRKYLSWWEDVLRANLSSSPNILSSLIDTNWKDLPYFNAYMGIGGSIIYQKPIFFSTNKGKFKACPIDSYKGSWGFTLPVGL